MTRHLAALAVGTALVSSSPVSPRADAAAAAPARPNVIFVLADDLGYAELGSYGQQKIRTPSLDRLAAEGVRFTQHYSGNAVCAPSRSVLLTGQHPGHTPIRDNRELQPEGQLPLPAAAVTIAELFKAQGYATAAMGKWGLGPPGSEGDPLRQGFDHFFGYNCQRHAHDYYPTYLYDDDRRLPLDNGETRDVAAARPDVVARLEALLSRQHQPSAELPIPAMDGETPRYVVGRSAATTRSLLEATESAWGAAQRITWGPDSIATSFRALSTRAGLAVRYDVTDPSPWHTLTQRDERLWNEEVVELFLDVGATGRSYAEVEWNPVNAVVDLWVDRPENRFDKDWNVTGLESRVHPRRDAAGRPTGWTAVGLLPWKALASKAPPGTALPPKAGDRWRLNVFRIERPGGPKDPERGAQYLPWSPTGNRSFHVPLAFRELVFAGTTSP